MADSKITALTAISTVDPAADPLVIVDVSDTSMAASGTTKKATINQLLGASGTATLASATITGDLTVRTNQLVVNSSGSFVGKSSGAVGTDGVQLLASGFSGFSASGTTALFVNRNTSDGTVLQLGRSGASAADFGAIAGGGFTVGLSGSEWMRINSTGLGVGGAPLASHLITSQGPIAISGTGGGTRTSYISNTNACSIYYTDGGGSGFFTDFGNLIIQPRTSAGRSVVIATSAAAGTPVERLIVDPNGNCGIGVTPSAWVAGAKALQFGAYGALAQSSSGNIELSFNSYNSGAGAYKYLQTDTASLYRASSVHSWFVAPSGTAGNAITFTQAMTLDASGNLILLSSNTPATLTTNGQLTVNATSNTNLRFSYRGSDGVTRVANITLA